MKKCPLCERVYENETFCPHCNLPLIDLNKEEDTFESMVIKRADKQVAQDKTKDKKFIVGGIVLILALFMLPLILYISQQDFFKDKETKKTVYTSESRETISEQKNMETDLSDVSINAYDNDAVQVSGHIEEYRGNLWFVFNELQNIYLFDKYMNKAVVEEGVGQAIVENESGNELNRYIGRNMTVNCSISKEDENVILSLQGILDAEEIQDNTGIHAYQVVIEDCTWEEARQRCIDAGGYLVRINSEEEFDYITNLLNSRGYSDYHFYLGGRRELSDTEYYWVNEENQFLEGCLNSAESWAMPHWYNNEPSFQDTGSDAPSAISEDVMNLFFVSESWYLNDSSSDLPGDYPSLLSGKVGYIVETE